LERVVGIRCTGVEEFSRGFMEKKLAAGEGERSQSLGAGRRTERSLLSGGGYEEQILASGGIMTIDPVCGMRVEEKKPELQSQYAGRKYFFCSEECKQEFEADPNGYVETVAA
jgi:YHS domain-containing protein